MSKRKHVVRTTTHRKVTNWSQQAFIADSIECAKYGPQYLKLRLENLRRARAWRAG